MIRISVIDDDKDMLSNVSGLLSKNGFIVSTFTDWKEAYLCFKRFQPQIILLDVFLKGIDGFEICQKLKSSPYTKRIPVLIYSGFPYIAEKVFKDYGASDFLPKPFVSEELINKIHSILDKRNVPSRNYEIFDFK